MLDADGHAAINAIFAAVGALAGWHLGDFIAKKLGYYSGNMYNLIRAGVVVGGAVIGWFSAKVMTRLLTSYLKSNPSIVFKLSSRLGITRFHSIMKFLGINPFTLPMNSSKFIGLARLYNSSKITMGLNWALELYKKAQSFGYGIELDPPHGKFSWHIHFTGGGGRLSNIHIQITKSAWDALSKIID